MVAWAQRRGWSVRETARSGCPPMTGLKVRITARFALDCAPTAEAALARIASDRRLKLVILSGRWPLYRDAPPFYDVNSPRVTVESIARPGFKPSLTASLKATLDAIVRR
ncbi:SGNH hydrolase domain-containing protein [Caulobacter segnis]